MRLFGSNFKEAPPVCELQNSKREFIFNNKILSASFCGFVLAMLSVFLFKYYSKQDDTLEVIAYACGAATATFTVLTLMQTQKKK